MSNTGYNDKQLNKLRTHAEKAFQLMAEDPSKQHTSESARVDLYNWLINIDTASKQPEIAVSDEMVSVYAAAIEQGKTVKEALTRVFQATFQQGALLSRQADNYLWEQTGFHVDSAVSTVFAKVGKAPYQPIGFDDGKNYIAIESSKTLWTRQFALSLLVPLQPAFKITKREDYQDEDQAAAYLTEAQVAIYQECIDWFTKDLIELSAIPTDASGETPKAELLEKMRDTIDLARRRIPTLDRKLDALAKQHGDITGDMPALVRACSEYLSLKLNENAVRKMITTTELGVSGDKNETTRQAVLKSLQTLLKDGRLCVDDDTAAASMSAAYVAIPEMRGAIEATCGPEATLEQGVVAAINLITPK